MTRRLYQRRQTRVMVGYGDPTATLVGLITQMGGWWWDTRVGVTISTGVSSWSDRIQGFAVAQPTAGKQPAFYNGKIIFDGVDDFLYSTSNVLNGLSACTIHLIGSHPSWGSTTPVFLSFGETAGQYRMVVYANGFSGLENFVEGPAGVTNAWDAGNSSMDPAVYTWQVDMADGSSATKPILMNGTSLGGSRTSSGACSGTFVTSSGQAFGAQTTSGANPSNVSIYGVVVLPTVSGANNPTIIPMLKRVYGV